MSRRNPKNNEIDKVQEVITEEFVDGDVTICDKFEYSVCALYAHKFCSDKSVTIDVEVVDGKSVAGEITELDAKETPNSVTLVWNGFKEAGLVQHLSKSTLRYLQVNRKNRRNTFH